MIPIPLVSGLLIAAAVLALLGSSFRRDGMAPIGVTLLLLGLSLGTIIGTGTVSSVFLALLLSVIGLALAWTDTRTAPMIQGALGTCGVGVVSLVASLWATPSVAAVLQVTAFATALPLFPLHGLFVGAVAHLPGSIATYLALALPILGLHGLVSLAVSLPTGAGTTLFSLALVGALYGGLKAMTRAHMGEQMAYVGVILFAIPWWHLALAQGPSQTAWYVSGVAGAMYGLRLAENVLLARFGHLDLEKVWGLARPMPRFATLVGLLILVTMGLPLFGVYSGFMALVLNSASTGAQGIVFVLGIWLLVSWLLVRPLHQLLFGQPRTDLLYRDLGWPEVLPLVVVLLLLGLSGLTPSNLFQGHDLTGLASIWGR